jgi:hypothetical protein
LHDDALRINTSTAARIAMLSCCTIAAWVDYFGQKFFLHLHPPLMLIPTIAAVCMQPLKLL